MTIFDQAAGHVRAWSKRVRPAPMLLSLVAWPFTAAGWIGGMTAVGYHLALAALRLGYSNARARYPNAR